MQIQGTLTSFWQLWGKFHRQVEAYIDESHAITCCIKWQEHNLSWQILNGLYQGQVRLFISHRQEMIANVRIYTHLCTNKFAQPSTARSFKSEAEQTSHCPPFKYHPHSSSCQDAPLGLHPLSDSWWCELSLIHFHDWSFNPPWGNRPYSTLISEGHKLGGKVGWLAITLWWQISKVGNQKPVKKSQVIQCMSSYK